jgi:proteasome beta subunit
MTFPLFSPGDDPGPSFADLLRRTGFDPVATTTSVEGSGIAVTHGTTVVAMTTPSA